MKRGSESASHRRPSGSNGFSVDPIQNRRWMLPDESARNSTERPLNHPPSEIFRYPLGDSRLTSESSSVNSTSPSKRTSSFSRPFDQLKLP
jgi:hypothetical protein